MTTSIVEEAKKTVKQNKKEANAMNKKHIIETLKTITISALIGGIITFAIGFNIGSEFQKRNTEDLQNRIKDISVATQLKK